VVAPRRADGPSDLLLPSNIQAIEETAIYARTSGYVRERYVDIGDRVTAGRVLAQIDTPELDQELSQARAALAQTRAGLAQAQASFTQAQANLQHARASLDQVKATEADLSSAIARTHQASAAQSTVASTLADLANAEEQKKQAEVRLGYTKIYAPVTGTVSVRAAREGEVLNVGQPIVTIVDLTDTWVRAAIPETQADHIGLGDTLRVRLPGGTITSGKVFFKSAEADFATQRDVNRRKRDIKTIVLKVRLDNPKGAYVPGMTAEVLVSPDQLKATPRQDISAEQRP